MNSIIAILLVILFTIILAVVSHSSVKYVVTAFNKGDRDSMLLAFLMILIIILPLLKGFGII